MYSLKLAHLLKEKTDADIYNFYIDIRAPGKGFEEFYNRIAEEGVHFIRGKVADVYPEPNGAGRLVLQAEDTLLSRVRKIPVDMVVLSVGLEAQADAQEVRRLFNITCSGEGWFLERHPKLAPVNTFTDGIFLAGCCQGPKDIPDTVAQASAAAAKALELLSRPALSREPTVAEVNEAICNACFDCQRVCPYLAVERKEIRDRGGKLVRVVARVNPAMCEGCGACLVACRPQAIDLAGYSNEQVFAQLEALAPALVEAGAG
jgi:heterodisulfide reductase subunit A